MSNIDRLISVLPEVRKLFHGDGFLVPNWYLTEIENMRIREPSELDYQGYMNEVLRESVWHPGIWMEETRQLIPPENRSLYLNSLQRDGCSPPCNFSLDKNFCLFATGGRPDWKKIVDKKKELKALEIEIFRNQFGIDVLTTRSSGLKKSDIFRIAENSGFTKNTNFSDEDDLVFESNTESKQHVRLEVDAGRDYKKWGSTSVRYRLENIPIKALGLQNLLIGGAAYSNATMGPLETHLNLHAHFRFSRFLTDIL